MGLGGGGRAEWRKRKRDRKRDERKERKEHLEYCKTNNLL